MCVYIYINIVYTTSLTCYFQDRADLASISSLEEHRFVQRILNEIDPQHR